MLPVSLRSRKGEGPVGEMTWYGGQPSARSLLTSTGQYRGEWM